MKKDHSHIDKILDILTSKGRWLILVHEKPDGDTIGCAVALAALGERLGKRVTLGGPDCFPPKYLFLLGDTPYFVFDKIPEDFSGGDCVIVCVDTSNIERAVKGVGEAVGSRTVVNIDHHADNSAYGDVNWIEPSASATGEMVTVLMSLSKWGISQSEANALYVAIVTDNGNFSFPSSSAKSHECAVKLLEAGADPGMVTEELEANLSENSLKLWGRAFSKVALFQEGLCALFWLTVADFEETGTTRQECENLVNFLLRIKGVRVAALCSETDKGVRVSLRARLPFSVHDIAAHFDGGGHNLASGCTIRKPLQEALSLLRTEMERHVASGVSGA
jgi:phosphoesterase RecJ-like protein